MQINSACHVWNIFFFLKRENRRRCQQLYSRSNSSPYPFKLTSKSSLVYSLFFQSLDRYFSWRSLSSAKDWNNSSVSLISQQVHIFYLVVSAVQLICMCVYAAGNGPLLHGAFISSFVCMWARILTSSTALGAAGALGHICLLRRGHHRLCHPTGHLLSSREEKDGGRWMQGQNYVFSSSSLWVRVLLVLVSHRSGILFK